TVLVPPGLDLVEAAGLPMNALTAHQALALLALPRGASLAVTGGAGALGGFVIQLAAHRGLRVVADAAPQDEPLLKQLGAETVVVPPGLDLVEAAGLPMNALTAHQALALLALPRGASLAVTGGAGALGGFVIQLAAHRGLRVVADAAPQDEPLLKQLGAETVV